MKANSLFVVMIVAAMLLALTGSVRADTMFTENFNDGTVGANLVNQGGNQVIGGQVYTSATQTSERNYIVTKDSDYAQSAINWTCTLDVDNLYSPANWVFLGIGSGLPAAGTWGDNGMWFYQPANALYVQIDTHNGGTVSLISAGANGFPTTVASFQGWTGLDQTGTASIQKVGSNLIFGWHETGYSYTATATVAISDYSVLSTSSKLFCGIFEGNTTSWVDNFNVTGVAPEPSTLGLLITGLLGLLAYAWRKRK